MRIAKRLRQLWHRRRFNDDLAEEVRIHVEMAEARLREAGASPEEARNQARQQFGNQPLVLENSRAVWSYAPLEQLSQDVRYGARAWRRSPGFAITVIASIGLAIGLNTALFTAFDHYVLRPLAVRDPGSLYEMEWTTRSGAGHFLTWKEYQALSEQKHVLAGSFATVNALRQLDEQPSVGQLVTPDFFEMLGAKVRMGRPFTAGDAPAPGVGAYVVLSDSCWKSRYGSDPKILGRKVFIRGQPFEVIGVADPEFKGVGPAPPNYWAPLTMYAALNNGLDIFAPATPGTLQAVIRLRPDVSLDAAKSALLAWGREQTRDYPDNLKAVGVYTESRATAVPLNKEVILAATPVFVAFALVLLTACANVSNMMLARAIMRQREIGIRLALGAARPRLIRQLLIEALLLSLAAAMAGWVISELALRMLPGLLYRTLPTQFARIAQFPEMHADYRVFGFLALIAVATALLFGLLPALQATRSDSAYAMRGDFGSDLRPSRLRNALIVAQVMVCALMLTTSLILSNNQSRINQRDLRVDPRGVLDVRVTSNSAIRIEERLGRESIVESIAAVSRAPLYGGLPALAIAPAAGSQPLAGSQPRPQWVWSYFNMVSPEYFELMRMPLSDGRTFTSNEAKEHSAVAIVSQAAARRMWPNASPLGKELRIDPGPPNFLFAAPAITRATVVGVARDVVNGYATSEVDSACVYFPLASGNAAVASLLVRVRGEASVAKGSVERAAEDAAPGQADLVSSLEEIVHATMYPFRAAFWVGTCLAGLAMVLVVSGIYGVLSFVVSQRQKEIGIRLALGASKHDVMKLILGQSMRLALLGTALGTAATLGLARVLASNINVLRTFEVEPYALAIALILVSAAAAAFVPSRRASGLDPVSTLRNE
jgi:predicted permease